MPRDGIHPDSPIARARLDANLKAPPRPPFTLTPDQMDVWRMVVATRAPQEWSGIDEYFAADLAIATIALRDARRRLAEEGPTITGPRGGAVINPNQAICNSLCNQVLRLSARLRLSAQDVGDEDNISTANARKRKREAEHRDALIDADADLIPRPVPRAVQSPRAVQ